MKIELKVRNMALAPIRFQARLFEFRRVLDLHEGPKGLKTVEMDKPWRDEKTFITLLESAREIEPGGYYQASADIDALEDHNAVLIEPHENVVGHFRLESYKLDGHEKCYRPGIWGQPKPDTNILLGAMRPKGAS